MKYIYAVVKGKESTRRRNQRRKRVHKRFERKVKIQELKIKEYRRKVSLPRNIVRLLPALSTDRILPDFVCDDVPLLPDGAVLPLNKSSESVLMYALIAMPTLYEFNLKCIHCTSFLQLSWEVVLLALATPCGSPD